MLYAVETKNMHTAVHELYIVKTLEVANALSALLRTIEEEGVDDGLWEDVNAFDYNLEEINFREVTIQKTCETKFGTVQIVNDSFYDIY